MKRPPGRPAPRLLLVLLLVSNAFAQTSADPALLEEIRGIRAVDNHAHPLRYTAEGDPPDDEYDALTFEGMEPFPLPVRLRPDNPEWLGAWRALYGYAHADAGEAHVKELLDAKRRAMNERGEAYPAWVLDQLGIDVMLANRAAMGRGLAPPRFRWVSFADPLMLPLNNEGARAVNPDYRSFYVGETRLLRRYMKESGAAALPPTLEGYLARVVTPTLERHRRDGAVAVKFEAAYLRSLDFADVPLRRAAFVYARHSRPGAPPPPADEYKELQDFLFRHIAREAGRLGLVVHVHTLTGAGGYFSLRTAHPLLLEQVFNDPTLRKTNFVLVHGGWPHTKEVAHLLMKPNVYADFSAQTFLLYPRQLSSVLRDWLEMFPEKVLFGTDSEPFAPAWSWEETGWLTTKTAREALALALTGMLADGEITRERASELARMVMRENAARLYGLEARTARR